MNRRQLLLCSTFALAATAAGGASAHGDGAAAPAAHAGHRTAPSQAEDTAFGRAGNPARVTRTVRVDMADSMRFTPDQLTVKRGETVRLVARNQGQVLHELVLGTSAELKAHAEAMRKFPEMEHEATHMIHVKPGASGEIVWQFTQPGEFQFACLLPGHFEAGMIGRVVVK